MAYEEWSVYGGQVPTTDDWNVLGSNDADFDDRLEKIESTIVTATDGATVTFDLSSGRKQYVSLGGDRTFDLSNDEVGMAFLIVVHHSGSARSITWWSDIDWQFGNEPTPGLGGAGSYDTYGFIKMPGGRYQGYVVSEGNEE